MEKKMTTGAKTLLGICLISICMIIATLYISGCSNSETENNTVVPQSTADTTVSGENATQKPIDSGSKEIISKDEAKRIALAHAKVSEEQAERFEIHSEYEDGQQVYEIEFDAAGFEYDYEIDAKTGAIVQFSKEPR